MTDLVKTTMADDFDVDDPSIDEGLLMNDDSFDLDLDLDSIVNGNISLSGVPEQYEEEVDDLDEEPAIDDEPTMDDFEPIVIDDIDEDEPALVDDIMESTIKEEPAILIEEEHVVKNTPVYSESTRKILSITETEPKKKTSSKKKKDTLPKKKTSSKRKKKKGDDPLHRLYATQTSATKHQNYKRAKEYEKSKFKDAPIWGVDEKALRKARQLKSSNTNRPSRAIEYSIEKASAKQRNAIEKKKVKAKAKVLDIWGVDDKAMRKASFLKTKYGNIPPSEYLTQITNATHHQQWLVYKELEKSRRKEIKIWGVDERNNTSFEEYDQQSAPVYNNKKYNYRSTSGMSITSNMSNRKRRPDMVPGYFSSSHSYSDYYYSGARRKRASSSKPFNDRSLPVPRDITPEIGSSSKNMNYLKKYGKTNNSTKSRSTRTTTSSSSAVHAKIRDVIIKDMDAQSVLTHDDNQSWIGGDSFNDDENDDQQEDVVEEKKEKNFTPKKEKKTTPMRKMKTNTKEEEKIVVTNNPEEVKVAKKKLKKGASPIKTEKKQTPPPEPRSPLASSPSPKKKEKQVKDGPSMASRKASDPHFSALQDKLQEAERKVLEETKALTKMQRLKKQTLQLFDKDKKKHSIRDILAKDPQKARLKRGKSLQFWKKRKDLDDNKSRKIMSISESIQEDDENESEEE